VAIATSGPGATNLITGIAGAFYDSVPVLFITGQVSTSRMVGQTGVRQIGFQETPIVPMVSAITKMAIQLTSPSQIRYELERAFWVMRHGRPGPVLIDIPDDLQREQIIWDQLESYSSPSDSQLGPTSRDLLMLEEMLRTSQRPVLIAGWGIHLSKTEDLFRNLVERWNAPTLLTWAAADLLPGEHPLRVGTFGTHGTRHANLALQNADLVVSIGSRLDTKATGSPVKSFARSARKVVVDIDETELGKFAAFDLNIDLKIHADARNFLDAALDMPEIDLQFDDWLSRIRDWKGNLRPYDTIARTVEGIDPYRFMRDLVSSAPKELDFFLDTGCTLPWLLQEFEPDLGHRVFHDFNNTAMGWALPAMFGGVTASPERLSVCIVGDGSLMMSVHELATLSGLERSAKVIVIDNSGYSMIRQTQDQWLGSNYVASSPQGGLFFPDFRNLAEAFGFDYEEVHVNQDAAKKLAEFWKGARHQFLRIIVHNDARVVPQVKFGRPNEDMDPLLPRETFLEAMLIEPLDVSRQ
jgi:acetolactate synthase-1/2/3 large subunit